MDKTSLRKQLRAARREHVAQLPDAMRGLVFRHPPAPLLSMIGDDAVIGLYRAMPEEAPTTSYAGFFQERGHSIALPRFADRSAPMEFALHSDPYGEADLEEGAFGLRQPLPEADTVAPDVLFVPLIGFTESGERLGQGLTEYSAAECRSILGLREEEQATRLGYAPRAAVVHRDHMVRA